MRLKVKILKLFAGKPVAILREKTADELGAHVHNRISISKKGMKYVRENHNHKVRINQLMNILTKEFGVSV